MKKFVGIDVGGTAIKYALLNEKGEILTSGKRDTEAHLGGAAIQQKVVEIVELYKEENVQGICISTAGMVDIEKGEIFFSGPTIPHYAGTKYKEVLEQKFSVPCEVENDVNSAGLAEAVSGAGKDSHSVLCLTIGTGIGGCFVYQKEVFHGYSNSACEIGYLHMEKGNFQELGATSVLSKKVAEKKQESIALWNGLRIFEEAKKGDVDCISAIEDLVDVLGKGIANLCYVLNPEVVVLGGGIMEQGEFLRQKIEKSLKQYLLESVAKHTKLCVAEHKNHAGILGAFYHFQRMQEKRKSR